MNKMSKKQEEEEELEEEELEEEELEEEELEPEDIKETEESEESEESDEPKKSRLEKLIEKGEKKLKECQTDVVNECMTRKNFGLSLPMGYGKTIISIVTALKKKLKSQSNEPILVVIPKSIIGTTWQTQIREHFGSKLRYQILNSTKFELKSKTMIILATPTTIGKIYKKNGIHEKFIKKEIYHRRGIGFPISKNVYVAPVSPYLETATDGSVIYAKKWACLIIDEGHKFTNIATAGCQGISSVCSPYRMILSGTMFNEPTMERLLGYHTMIQYRLFPNNLPDAIEFVKSPEYRGTRETIVERKEEKLKDVKIIKNIIQHDLSREEGMIYVSMKNTLSLLKTMCDSSTRKEDRKKFSTYILAVITYIRQGIVAPVLPIANITLTMSNMGEIKNDLTLILMKEFNNLNIKDFLNKESSAKSTRMTKILEITEKHNKKTDKIVGFACFCTSLSIIEYYFKKDTKIKVYRILSSHSIQQRQKMIEDFQNSEENSILLLTYELGAEGLNLQCANVVLIFEHWWNQPKTSQAVARVIRNGQKNPEVFIYFFTSNTGIEQALYKKQQDKIILMEELKNGTVRGGGHKIRTLKINEILKLIDINENRKYLEKMY